MVTPAHSNQVLSEMLGTPIASFEKVDIKGDGNSGYKIEISGDASGIRTIHCKTDQAQDAFHLSLGASSNAPFMSRSAKPRDLGYFGLEFIKTLLLGSETQMVYSPNKLLSDKSGRMMISEFLGCEEKISGGERHAKGKLECKTKFSTYFSDPMERLSIGKQCERIFTSSTLYYDTKDGVTSHYIKPFVEHNMTEETCKIDEQLEKEDNELLVSAAKVEANSSRIPFLVELDGVQVPLMNPVGNKPDTKKKNPDESNFMGTIFLFKSSLR